MSYLLKNKNLEVIIGAPAELYNGSRFDASGNIFQVTLNQKHTFCTTEKKEHHPEYGFGLLNEFDIEEPYSFKNAKPGSPFHKIGVGSLLKKTTGPYNFYQAYEKKMLDYSVSKTETNKIAFNAESINIRGMKYKYSKTISIVENRLVVEYYLKNTGLVTFDTTEYCHNFLAINKRKTDASYRLKINQYIEESQFKANVNTEQVLSIDKNEIVWKTTPEKDFFIAGLTGSTQKCTGWHLENIDEKAAVSETVDFDCKQINLWGNAHVLSPELFFTIHLAPGREIMWKRKYTFHDLT
jgi:hypothetical protein